MYKKILISAFIGSENLGDEAIFKSILGNIGFDKACFSVLSINEEKTQSLGVKTFSAKSISGIFRAIKECDCMLMGGGGIIQDQSSILNLLYFSFQIAVAGYYRKPVILCFVGVGPITYRISKTVFRLVAKNIRFAVVRDEKSKMTLANYLDNSGLVVAAHDPALNFLFHESQLSPSRHKAPYIVFSVKRWFFAHPLLPARLTKKLSERFSFSKKYELFIENLAGDIDIFLNKHPSVDLVFVSFFDSEDIPVIEDVKKKMINKDRVFTAGQNLSEVDYVSLVRGSLFVAGMRLHSLVLSAAAGKSFVSLSSSDKVAEFTRQFGLEKYSIDIENYVKGSLSCVMDDFVALSPGMDADVERRLSAYKTDNLKAFVEIKNEIDRVLRF